MAMTLSSDVLRVIAAAGFHFQAFTDHFCG
jgi:hypothetical protein